jgi:hypothetical protein
MAEVEAAAGKVSKKGVLIVSVPKTVEYQYRKPLFGFEPTKTFWRQMLPGRFYMESIDTVGKSYAS